MFPIFRGNNRFAAAYRRLFEVPVDDKVSRLTATITGGLAVLVGTGGSGSCESGTRKAPVSPPTGGWG